MWYKKWTEKKKILISGRPRLPWFRRAAFSASFIDSNYLNFGHWNFTLITISDKER